MGLDIAGLHTECWGDRRDSAVVLAHGWAADAGMNWKKSRDALEGLFVVAPDMPGHGQSNLDGRFSLQMCADKVGAVLDELGVTQAVIVGYSMGGPITQLLARSRPDLVSALVQVATAAKMTPVSLSRDGAQFAKLLVAIAKEASTTVSASARSMAAQVRESGVGSLLTKEDQPSDAADDEHIAWLARHADPSALAQAGVALARYDARSWLGELSIPVTSICTLQDVVIPPHYQQALADLCQVPQTRRFSIDGGHGVCLDESFGAVLRRAVVAASTGL